jgi:hypothetical protein
MSIYYLFIKLFYYDLVSLLSKSLLLVNKLNSFDIILSVSVWLNSVLF